MSNKENAVLTQSLKRLNKIVKNLDIHTYSKKEEKYKIKMLKKEYSFNIWLQKKLNIDSKITNKMLNL